MLIILMRYNSKKLFKKNKMDSIFYASFYCSNHFDIMFASRNLIITISSHRMNAKIYYYLLLLLYFLIDIEVNR